MKESKYTFAEGFLGMPNEIECFCDQSEMMNEDTKWPKESLDILGIPL